jgi:hypothetical protein
LLSGFFVAKLVLADNVLEIDISSDQVSGWHQVVVVHELDEWLDLGSSLDFLLAHSLGHLQWVPFNACHQSVSEFLILKKYETECELTFFPSSCCLTMMAFFPACLPARRMTTLPGFILKIRSYSSVIMEGSCMWHSWQA